MPSEIPKPGEVFTFPDLVYKELIAMLAAMAVLTLWSIRMDAPLKAMADPNWTENPAKAPWYFVGLQELLVYFDPWIAGVCVPALIIFGLAAIPYIDKNPEGVGVYTVKKRKLAVFLFLFGYILWFLLICIGQFFRGPSWQFYWPWESWEIEKTVEETLVNMSNPIGILILLAYFGVGLTLPALVCRDHFRRMGAPRYLIAWGLVWMMFFVVMKIILRLFFHIKYILTMKWFSI